MKRVGVALLSVVVGVGLALPAMAATVKFSGYYRVRGYTENNTTANDKTAGANSFYDNRLDLQMAATVNDRLSVHSEFWIHNGVWGTGTSGMHASSDEGLTVRKVWMAYKPAKDITVNIGKQGYGWTAGYNVLMDRKYQPDSIVVHWKMGPGTLTLADAKLSDCSNSSGASAAGDCPSVQADADHDLYEVAYGFKAGSATLHPSFMYDRSSDKTTNAMYKLWYPRLWGAAKFGPFNVRGEAAYTGGKVTCDGTTTTINTNQGINVGQCTGTGDAKYQAMAAYLQGGYTFGFGEVGLQFVYASGDDNPTDDKIKAWGSKGSINYNDLGQFSAIALRHQDETGLLWYKNGEGGVSGIGTVNGAKSSRQLTNAYVYGAYGEFKVYGGRLLTNVFYAKADKAYLPDQSKSYGTEFDATYQYPIMKELVLSGSGGYLWAGDYFKGASSGASHVDKLKDPWVLAWTLYAYF